ncbi:MAG: AraC family transcriptional regulator [Saccharofermentanales bacterium]
MILPGKQFEFDNLFNDESQKFGPIKLFQIGELSCISGYVVPPHKQWCHEISYVVSGEGLFTTNDETILLKEGDIHISPSGSIHAIETANNSDLRYSYIGFNFDDDLTSENLQYLKNFYLTVSTYKASDRSELLLPIFRSLDELYSKAMFYHLMVETYLIQMLVLVCRSFTMSPLPIYFPAVSVDSLGRSVYVVIKYIDGHIFEKIDLKMIAHEVGYNYSYISDVFKKKTGITIQKYINNRKIQEATELLKYGKLTIYQVAHRLSYANVQSFNKAFKRTIGYPPSEYLKKCSETVQGNSK